ncbi:25194_t:CDS:2, partial [Racocetra persica]
VDPRSEDDIASQIIEDIFDKDYKYKSSMTDNSSSLINEQDSELTMQDIIWKMIESAQIKIIKEAFRFRYRKDSKLISEYAKYIKNLRNADNQDKYIKYTAITLFPNNDAYNKRMSRYRKWYQGKKKLLTSIEDLYNLYYKLSKKDWLMTETEIEEAIENILIDE